MLKKSDLAKQFDIVVQQEVKNYQDSLNFVLQSIRDLKVSIQEVREESLENHALLHSNHNDLALSQQYLHQTWDNSDSKLLSHINDFNAFKKTILEKAEINTDYALENSRKNEHNKNTLDLLAVSLEKLQDEVAGYSLFISKGLDAMTLKLAKDMNKFKEKIDTRPSESSIIRKELEDKIDSHVVDVEGIMRELLIYKKENFITQKKIENIYTLIERLSKSEAIS